MRKRVWIITLALLLVMPCAASGQSKDKSKQSDSIVSLLNAVYAKLIDTGIEQYRQVKGPATFLHNGAYLFCDSAIWHINARYIEAFQNVRIVQDKTVLSSDKLEYYIERDLAQFRGNVVQLTDKDNDTLRSNNLDYNTRDSVAVFRDGGSMKNADGNVIEVRNGTYDSKIGQFTFSNNVQMFIDTLYVRTSTLTYDTNLGKAFFGDPTYLWQSDGFMRASAGWYERNRDLIFFNDNVYMNTPEYETWGEELYYYRPEKRVEMYRNVQLLDTLRQAVFLSDKAEIVNDTISNIDALLTVLPAVIYYGENENHEIDSLFCSADSLRFWTMRREDVPDSLFKNGQDDKKNMLFDAIGQAEQKAAEERERARVEAEAKRPEAIARERRNKMAAKAMADSIYRAGGPIPDSLQTKMGEDFWKQFMEKNPDAKIITAKEIEALQKQQNDSLAANAVSDDAVSQQDSTQSDTSSVKAIDLPVASSKKGDIAPPADILPQAQADTTSIVPLQDALADTLLAAMPDAVEKDSASVDIPADTVERLRFVEAYRNARIYRTDMQARADSVAFSEVDSIARLFYDPVLWNEGVNQLTADKMLLLMNEGNFERGSMQGSAFIISQEDSVHFNQIKSTEMLGYFTDNHLSRYDALGGVNAMFYLREGEEKLVTTLNVKAAQFMMMTMKDGMAERMKYYEQVKSDAYPVFDLEIDKQRIKGFSWRAEERPTDRFAITERGIRSSQRGEYSTIARPDYPVTDRYFNKYMSHLRDSLKAQENARIRARFMRDSIATVVRRNAEVDSMMLDIKIPELMALDSMMARDPEFALNPANRAKREQIIKDTRDSLYQLVEQREIERAALDAAEKQRQKDLQLERRRQNEIQKQIGELAENTIRTQDDTLHLQRAADSLTVNNVEVLPPPVDTTVVIQAQADTLSVKTQTTAGAKENSRKNKLIDLNEAARSVAETIQNNPVIEKQIESVTLSAKEQKALLKAQKLIEKKARKAEKKRKKAEAKAAKAAAKAAAREAKTNPNQSDDLG
ncbi:MAG: hypothetical protein HUJ93_02015 [Bacteroidales bacterium]|nr:hypothetical protein [Bacteroidales bacterium]